ncbi:uncharacterized protein METZ01_LOCUS223300 [marine metagenome]|uniref:Uncharacterized protein n=1 Tax=marine metagenome TaxID=408172 RepID=A0A382G595_9ZZZZ
MVAIAAQPVLISYRARYSREGLILRRRPADCHTATRIVIHIDHTARRRAGLALSCALSVGVGGRHRNH